MANVPKKPERLATWKQRKYLFMLVSLDLVAPVHTNVLNKDQDLDSMGYPKPSTKMLVGFLLILLHQAPYVSQSYGTVLVNTFEDTFGDIYGEGIWSEFNKITRSSLNRNVVALASFKGDFTVMCYTISCLTEEALTND